MVKQLAALWEKDIIDKEDAKANQDTVKQARLQLKLTEREAEIGRLNGKLAAEMRYSKTSI